MKTALDKWLRPSMDMVNQITKKDREINKLTKNNEKLNKENKKLKNEIKLKNRTFFQKVKGKISRIIK
ncbi:hypothetical protein [Methanobrevibacter arboriphilus]|uniref:hypothetical protein n=1 Tax=Methanobrevibacter arboriphilus TaxID=39441 RepID=UPI0005B28951|nr:hypothetical protein [Methanobrevibacter arboriphilus]